MRLWLWPFCAALLTSCISHVEPQLALKAETTPEIPTSRLFSRYLNQAITVSETAMGDLELEGKKLESCGGEYEPLLGLGLDGFIAHLEAEGKVPFSLKCQAPAIRQDLQVCDFPPIPAMPLSNDCRNQLAMLRIRLVMQLDLDAPLAQLSATYTAHRLVAEMMSGDRDTSTALELSRHLLSLEPDDLDAHSLRVLLIFLSRQIDAQKEAFAASMDKLEHSTRLISRAFAHLMEFNVAHLAMIKARSEAHNKRLQRAAVQLAYLSPHPLAGREAEAVAAFYRGDRPEAIRIMREVASMPLADDSTQDALRKLEEGVAQPFKIRMFYSFQF